MVSFACRNALQKVVELKCGGFSKSIDLTNHIQKSGFEVFVTIKTKSVSSLFSMHGDHCVLLRFRSRLLKLNRFFQVYSRETQR